jgi:hypothetical protein
VQAPDQVVAPRVEAAVGALLAGEERRERRQLAQRVVSAR